MTPGFLAEYVPLDEQCGAGFSGIGTILSSQDLKYMREEVLKVLFAGYIVLGDVFSVISELEVPPGGYCDLFLGLDRRRHNSSQVEDLGNVAR